VTFLRCTVMMSHFITFSKMLSTRYYIQGADDKLGQFLGQVISKQLVIEMFVGIHWKTLYLWYELMLTNCFYSQKQVGKGSILCSCAKSSIHQ
jgi:hypothetical protein